MQVSVQKIALKLRKSLDFLFIIALGKPFRWCITRFARKHTTEDSW